MPWLTVLRRAAAASPNSASKTGCVTMCCASISMASSSETSGLRSSRSLGQELVENLPLGLAGVDNRLDALDMGAGDASDVACPVFPVAAITAFLDYPGADRFRQTLEKRFAAVVAKLSWAHPGWERGGRRCQDPWRAAASQRA